MNAHQAMMPLIVMRLCVRVLVPIALGALMSCQSTVYKPATVTQRVASKAKTVIHDSAPPGRPPQTFPVVTPRYEALSRYGNPSHYAVNGARYQVLNSARGYRARGLASWYGTKFHAKRTSSGEPYDMYALTAAHKTLPLPTYLRVKNLDNGKTIVVKVNDRGPFHSDRILDLSYGAAVKLGLFPRGVARVEIETIALPGKQKAPVAQYYLQVGAFNSRVLANQLQHKIVALTGAHVVVERYKTYFVVRVGPFSTATSAQQAQQKLQHQGVKGMTIFLQ